MTLIELTLTTLPAPKKELRFHGTQLMVQPALYLILAYLLPSISFVFSKPVPSPTPRPLVLWHGLGDSYASPGMLEFANEIKDVHPGIFIHSIYIDKDIKEDQRAGWVRCVPCLER
jgi:hypothetical protein